MCTYVYLTVHLPFIVSSLLKIVLALVSRVIDQPPHRHTSRDVESQSGLNLIGLVGERPRDLLLDLYNHYQFIQIVRLTVHMFIKLYVSTTIKATIIRKKKLSICQLSYKYIFKAYNGIVSLYLKYSDVR